MPCPDQLPGWFLWAPIIVAFLVSQLCGWSLYALHRGGKIELERFGFAISKVPIVFPLSLGTSPSRFVRMLALTYRLSVAAFLLSFVAGCLIQYPRANCIEGAETSYPNSTFRTS